MLAVGKFILEGYFAVDVGLGEAEGEEILFSVVVEFALADQSLKVLGREEDEEVDVEFSHWRLQR